LAKQELSAEIMKKREILVVLSSPSGVGKTTVCERILRKHRTFVRSVSATTRTRRRGERQGRDYVFLTEEQFKRKIRNKEFVEWAWVHGHRYGTLNSFVARVKKAGNVAFFVVDVQGGMAMKRKYPQSLLIFLLPPSMSELKRRLVKRGTERMGEMKQRMKTGLREMAFWSKYDYVVINKNLNQAVKSVEKIIESERLKSARFDYPNWRRGRGVT
jgi:guanylate kinase